MQHHLTFDDINLQGVWLTIGSFDGVHIGHQAIIRDLTNGAHREGALAVVITFHPHLATVLRDRKGAFYLTTPQEQAENLGSLGVDLVITHPFNIEVANTSARDFINLGDEFDFSVSVIQPIMLDGQIVSSSRIRSALANGNLPEVTRMLGHPYLVKGTVIPGDKRGHTLGIPTANLDIWQEKALPKTGVYACLADVDGRKWLAVTNIGVRPTFENLSVKPRMETHLLDFDKDIYNHEISLSFHARLRDEMRFDSIDHLTAQIKSDIQRARELFDREYG